MLNKTITFMKNEAIRRTFGYYFLFVCLGLDIAIGGPTLPALASQTGTSIEKMGLLFLAGSSGYTLGTLAGGRIIDRLRGHPVMGIAQLYTAVMIALVPLAPWFWLLLVLASTRGFAEGIINTGANALLMWTHGEKAGPFMNALHFFYGLGAFLSPFLVALVINIPGGYRWAYWALSCVGLLAGLRMLTMKGSPRPIHAQADGKASTQPRSPVPYALVISAILFLFFYVSSEITFSGWVYTYATTLKLASISGAAYLTSAFWAAFTFGRLISIPAATRFKPGQVILAAVLSCLAILAVGMIFYKSSAVLWLMAVGLGFCMAPIWPTGFNLAGQSINLTGRLAGVILLGDSLGGMVLPSASGKVIVAAGPRAMVYLIFGSLVLNLAAFIALAKLKPAKLPSQALPPVGERG